MNVERLHAIAIGLESDFEVTGVLAKIKAIRDALQNQIAQPQQPAHQQQVAEAYTELREALAEAESNHFPPTWKQVLEELEVEDLLGERLLDRIAGVFSRNQITPSVAQQEIDAIATEIEKLHETVSELTGAFDHLSIGAEELDPGTCELGVIVPRDAVNNNFKDFARELDHLDKTFSPFAELATGNRPGFTIRSISSTDLTVFLDLVPEIAACLVVAVERVVALYKNLLEIRTLRQGMVDQGVDEGSLQGVDSFADKHMEKGIKELVKELLAEHGENIERGRKNELKNELTIGLNGIANRIDKGYNIEIRVEPLEEDEGVEEDGEREPSAEAQVLSKIESHAKKIVFLKPTGASILSLPEPNNGDDGDGAA